MGFMWRGFFFYDIASRRTILPCYIFCMYSDPIGLLLLLFCFAFPFVIPLVIGIHLVTRRYASDFTRLAGYLTLKPLLATPIWAAIMLFGSMLNITYEVSLYTDRTTFESKTVNLLYIIGTAVIGLGLTGVILWIFRGRPIWRSPWRLVLLLALDTLRWGSTALIEALYTPAPGVIAIALAMPTIFAIAAWLTRYDEGVEMLTV